MLLKYADMLILTLKQELVKSDVQDLSDWYNYTTFDLTGEFAFNEPFHCLDKRGYHFFIKAVVKGTTAAFRIIQLERWGLWTLLQPLIPRSAFRAKHDMDQYTEELVDRRMKEGIVPGKADVFNYLLQNKGDDKPQTRHELYDNAIILVVAGSETTATLMCGVTELLAKNSDKYRKVVAEVRGRFMSDAEITVQSVNDLPYMIACLSEALRVFPPSPWGFPRIIDTPGGQAVAGYHVPEKMSACVYHYAASRSEKNFTRPDDFVPERWLENPPAEFANDNRAVVQPFHVGPRACLGKPLAYAEMRLLLAKMVWHFDFELEDPSVDWMGSLKAFTVWERAALRMRLTPVSRKP